ncbi:MAG: hypothetical protein AB8F78_00825 [Saprospiraceae bacterium]
MSLGRKPLYNRPFARVGINEVIESLADDAVVGGQSLRDSGDFNVSDHANGLWTVKAGGYETEIQLTGRKIKDYRCDCPDFERREQCAHFAALVAIVHLRKQPKAKKSSAPRKTQLSMKKLLNSVEDRELREFVQEYARKHSDFALDLKVRFAEALPLSNRFEQVLTRLFKRTSDQFSPRQAKRVTEALHQFEEQRKRWLADKAFLDIFELNTTLIPKLVVVLGKADRISVDIKAYLIVCISELSQVVQSNPPPVILERIETWLEEERQRGAYFRNQVDLPLYELGELLGESIEETKAEILEANDTYGVSESRIEALMQLYYRNDLNEEAERLLIDHLDQPRLVLAALQTEISKSNFRRAVKLAGAALKHQNKPDDALRLRQFLLASAIPAKKMELIIEHAPEVLVATGELSSITAAIDELEDEPAKETFQACLTTVAASKLHADVKSSLSAELLLRLSDYAELEKLLYRSDSDVLIGQMMPKLVGKLPTEDFQLLLETKLREYLSNRFGKGPAIWAAGLLDDVARRSRKDITSTLIGRLRQDFKQRNALIDALDDALL